MEIIGYIKKRKLLLFSLLAIFILIEIFGFATRDIFTGVAALDEIRYTLDEVQWVGYSRKGQKVTSNSSSDYVLIEGIPSPVKNIGIGCENDTKAISYITYIAETDTSEEEKFFVSLDKPMNVASLPKKVEINSLKVFLTDRGQDNLVCYSFILNEKSPYNFSVGRLIIYLIVFVMVIWYDTLGPIKQKSLENRFHTYSFFIFSWIIAILDLTYPVILTYDSGHYLWLADLLRTNQLQLWDPIRNVGYPLYLRLGQVLLGYNQMSALIPMIINHIILYVFACLIIFEFFDFSQRQKTFVKIIVFLFIALDTTIFGYYHVLLTEQLAATLAIISCYVAIKLYKSEPFSRTFYISLIYFAISILVAWHIKQPYLGAALFPFLISSFLFLLKSKNRIVTKSFLILFILSFVLLLLSISSWNNILRTAGNEMEHNRLFSTWLLDRFPSQLDDIGSPNETLLIRIGENYLVAANFYGFDRSNRDNPVVIKEPLLTRSAQNGIIAHRLFSLDTGLSNLFYAPPYAEYMAYLKSPATPPGWLERMLENRIDFSNLLFTISYLILPFSFLIMGINYFLRPTSRIASLLILAGVPLFNAIAHSVYTYLDRYYFLGYPILLCLWILLLIEIINIVIIFLNN
jgi:hypothetical protein